MRYPTGNASELEFSTSDVNVGVIRKYKTFKPWEWMRSPRESEKG